MSRYSVLMSVYARENPDWLEMSIRSMLEQTAPPEQFVIVKDGPLPPALDAVVDRYDRLHPGLFTIVALGRNVGLGEALARGIRHCRNELIARMDSDDYSLPTRCERELALFGRDPNLACVGCFELEFVDDIHNVVQIHTVPESHEEIDRFMRRRCALLHPTVLYKKSAVLAAGNYRPLPFFEDYDLFIRMMRAGARCRNIQEGLYAIRVNAPFFRRRGGLRYVKAAVGFKYRRYREGYFSLRDFAVSAGGHVLVALMPNPARIWFYRTFLREDAPS